MQKFISESWLVLVMGICFAMLLAGAQLSLYGQIQVNQVKARDDAIRQVVPNVDTIEKVEDLPAEAKAEIFRCLAADGSFSGWAVSAGGTGFVDKIGLVVGLSPDLLKITGVKVIDNLETPGLGNKIEGPWADQFSGMDAAQKIRLTKSLTGAPDEVEAITGATYSSMYVTEIVNDVCARVRPLLAELR